MAIRTTLFWAALWIGIGVGQSLAKDRCHVYVVDAQKALDLTQKQGDDASAPQTFDARTAQAETRFEEFEPELGEEELTTKHFEMPNGKYHITASVFYTDELLRLPAEQLPMESVMIGIVVSDRRHEDAFSIPENAVSETAYSRLSIAARVKQRVTLAGLEYLVGMECQFAESYDNLSRALRVMTSGDAPDSDNPPRQPPPRPPNP